MTRFDFDALDTVDAPDQWPDILRRSEDDDEIPVPQQTHRPLLLSAAAVVAAVGAVAGMVAIATSSSDDPATDPPASADDGEPTLCVNSDLPPEGIPDDAMVGPTDQPGQRAWSWTESGLQVELLAPPKQYIDFLGERTEQIDAEGGLIWYRPEETRLLTAGSDCERFELAATGGAEADRAALLRAIAPRIHWAEPRGPADCGTVAPGTAHLTDGPVTPVATMEIEDAGLVLEPIVGSGSARDLDGRCQFPARTQGGMEVDVTVSGNSEDGYAIDQVVGFSGDADPLPTYQGRRTGTRIEVLMDYWCDDCTEATLTVSYPEQGMTESTTITTPGGFTLELPELPPVNPSGFQVIVYRAANGDVRGVFADTEPAFLISSNTSNP